MDINRFNRYMVECEFGKGLFNIHLKCVLIDTWWNVNLENIVSLYVTNVVLIDTWWNVNSSFGIILSICPILVLIDTWWNVNSVQQLCYFPVSSFNRYMVECEFIIFTFIIRRGNGFNRYMVECE